MGRAASTVSREISSSGGRLRYRAWAADQAAWRCARRPKVAKLVSHPRLQSIVADKLRLRWSPQQIAGWLRREHGDDPELQVSHETIYTSLFVPSLSALTKGLTRYLRTRRTLRRPRATRVALGRGHIPGRINIRARPTEADDRAIPGHWEGDLVLGKANSAVVTLVERSSRFLIVLRLPHGRSSQQVLAEIAQRIVTLPTQIRRSLTWDQGKEMSWHERFTVETGLPIFFCDPRSPWQRGTNENTNGLLRQYFPKGTDLSRHSVNDLKAVAAALNSRPRKTLGWKTPAEALDDHLCSLQQGGVATTP